MTNRCGGKLNASNSSPQAAHAPTFFSPLPSSSECSGPLRVGLKSTSFITELCGRSGIAYHYNKSDQSLDRTVPFTEPPDESHTNQPVWSPRSNSIGARMHFHTAALLHEATKRASPSQFCRDLRCQNGSICSVSVCLLAPCGGLKRKRL